MRYIVEFDLADIPEHLWPRAVAAALRDVATRVEGRGFDAESAESTVRSGYDPDGLLGYHGHAATPEDIDAMREGRKAAMSATPEDRAAMRNQAMIERLAFEGLLTDDDEDEEPAFRP